MKKFNKKKRILLISICTIGLITLLLVNLFSVWNQLILKHKEKEFYTQELSKLKEEEEYLDIRINLKKPDDIQERIHHKSKLYALCCGLMELENPGVTQDMNIIKKVDINEFREFINNLSEMTIRVKTEYGNNFTYNTFIVTSCKA